MWCQPTALQQYYPLSGTTFWLDYHLWGFWPLPYHVENVLLHAVSAVLFWQLLRRLETPGAWLAGAVFALHPVMVESAGWITERKNVLSLVFYLGALVAYGRFNSFWKEDNGSPARHGGAYVLALLLCLGALLAKTTAFSLPAVIVLIGWWKRGRVRWRDDVLPTLPMFALSIGFCLMTAWLEKTHVGAQGPDFALSFPERWLIAGRAPWFYIGKLLWPANLCFVYPRWQPDAGSWRPWLYPAATVGLLVALWLARRRMGRGPATAAFFFVGTLFPLLGFFNAYGMRYSFVWNHWVYLPSLGLIALAAALAARAAVALRAPRAVYGVAAGVLVVLGVSTWRQARIYHDVKTLWGDTLMKNPRCWMAHNNLGDVLLQEGKGSEAKGELEQALRIKPDYAEGHYNLGNVFLQEGKVSEAKGELEQALRIRPAYAEAHYNLGNVFLQEGKVSNAIAQYEQALRIKPYLAEAHNNLGFALAQTGKTRDAIAHYQQALRIKPDYAEAHCNLGAALGQAGRMPEAIGHLERALRIKPEYPEAHGNLGTVYLREGKVSDAAEEFEQALRIKPEYYDAHNNLGDALVRLGRLPEAIVQYQQALQNNPGNADARSKLGAVLIATGHAQDARSQLEQALRINPDLIEAQNNLAWVLAILPPAEGGDPVRAVALAERACERSGNRAPRYLDTLAAAYAAAGRFEDAVATARNAIDLARSTGQAELVEEIEARLEVYRSGRAYRQSTGVTNR
jgi:tetratricopeptide (TPR) repeat protein